MMTNKTHLITAAIILFSANLLAEPGPTTFDDIDVDADGCINKEEAKVRDDLVKNFVTIDRDKGGTICVDEYTIYQNKDEFVPDDVEVPEVGAAPVL